MNSTIVSRYVALKQGLDPGIREGLQRLSAPRPLRACASIAAEWLAIAAGIALYRALELPWLYPFLVVWVGSRMFGLWVLAHDGLHRTLFANPRTNDTVTRVLLAWPIFVSLSEFRRVHLRHHRALRCEGDPEADLAAYPDFRFPISRRRLWAVVLLDLSGANFVRFFLKKRWLELRATVRGERPLPRPGPGALLYFASAMALLTAFELWTPWLLYWLVPYATWRTLLLRLRLMAEHLHLPESNVLQTRTVIPYLLEGLMLVPHHVSYHVEHHLCPELPAYQLPRAHQYLGRSERFRELAPPRRGYVSVFRDHFRDHLEPACE